MENISTSTQLLLLTQKVETLESYLGWTVAGVTLTITVLIALFVVIQAFYARKIQKEEIEKLENGLIEKINNQLDSKALDLQSLISQNVEELESKIDKAKISIEADIARTYALGTEDKGLFPLSISWWLQAAAFYNTIGEKELAKISVTSARKLFASLQKSDCEDLLEVSSKINDRLNLLRSNYPVEVGIIEGLMKDQIEILRQSSKKTEV